MNEKDMKELSVEELGEVAGGNIDPDTPVKTVAALKTILAANGPGEVGDMRDGEKLILATTIPAGKEFKVYIEYQMNGYIYSNSIINPDIPGYTFFYVKADDVRILN